MNSFFVFMIIMGFAISAQTQEPKLDPELQKKIDLCAEQDKKAAASEWVKFLEDKKSQSLEKYLQIEERPELCGMKYTLRSVTALRKFEQEYLKSLEKLSPKEASEKIKSRMDFLMKALGRDFKVIAVAFMEIIQLRGYELALEKLKLSENDKWLKQFKNDLLAKKSSVYEKMVTQDYRVMQWLVQNEPNLFPGREVSETEKVQLINKLEAEYKLLIENKDCLLSETCFYCVKEVRPKECSADLIEKRARDFGEAGAIIVPKVGESITNLNKRLKKFGNFE